MKPTHCPQGHPYDDENTYVSRDDRWHCRACNREGMRKKRAALKALRLAQQPPTIPTGNRYLDERIGMGSGCWQWLGYIDPQGYGRATVDGRKRQAHRVVYEVLRGPIPDGLTLDHLCRVRHCVNPSHLDPVTPRTNTLRGVGAGATNARKTHCKYGHPLAGDNLAPWSSFRLCMECVRRRRREAVLRRAREDKFLLAGGSRVAAEPGGAQ